MQAIIYMPGGTDDLIGEIRVTHTTESDPMGMQLIIYPLVPPGNMPEFNYIFESRMKTLDNPFHIFCREYKIWRELEQYTAQLFSEPLLRQLIKVTDDIFGIMQFFIMRDQPGHLHGKGKTAWAFFVPVFQHLLSREAVKGDIKFQRIKVLAVKVKPFPDGHLLRIEFAPPMLIVETRTSNVFFHKAISGMNLTT